MRKLSRRLDQHRHRMHLELERRQSDAEKKDANYMWFDYSIGLITCSALQRIGQNGGGIKLQFIQNRKIIERINR